MRGYLRLAAIGLAFAGVFALSGVANAADVYSRGGGLRDEPAPIVVPTWAGLYVGGTVGYGWGDFSDSFPFLNEGDGLSGSNPLDGVVFGGHIGYNFQRENVVFGVEASLNGTDMDSELFAHQVTNELDWYATAVGRLGYAYGNALFYGFGGVAWGQVTTRIQTPSLSLEDDATHVGWTAGLGVEYALSARFSVRLEYSHVDFGSETVFGGIAFEDKVDASFDAVKVGVNYKLTGERSLESLK